MRTFFTVWLLFAGIAAGQPPHGWYVVSSFAMGTRSPGGLFFVHPRAAQAPVPVTGLGADLLGTGVDQSGANCVAVVQDSRVLLVGELGPGGTRIDLHEITVAGTLAVVDTTTTVGTVHAAAGNGGISQIALLPNGDAVFCVGGLVYGPPLYGAALGLYSRATKAITPISMGISGVLANSVAVDPTGTTVYVGTAGSGNVVYAVPLSGGTNRVIASNLSGNAGLAVDARGQVLSTAFSSSPAIVSIDPATSVVTTIGWVPPAPNGLSLETVTDLPVYVVNTGGVYWLDRTGTSHLLTTGPTGVLSGIDVVAAPATYGAPTPGLVMYVWRTWPAPGGLPLPGSSTFAVRLQTFGPLGSPGALLASAARGDSPILGLRLLLEPSSLVALGTIAPATDLTIPIPAMLPPGAQLHLQSVHLDAGGPSGLSTSDGQSIHVIQ